MDATTLGLPAPASIANSWNATSFDPDRRAVVEVEQARASLEKFRAYLQEIADQGGTIDVAAEFEQFRARHVSLYRRAWYMQAGCMSSFIVGPSNFPVARAQKRFRSRDKAYGEIDAHAAAARKAVRRRAWPHGEPGGPIRGNNPDAPELLRAEIDKKTKWQETMRLVNKTIRSARPKTPEAQAEAVQLAINWSYAAARKIVSPDFCGRVGFPDYELTNNLANIKRLQGRLAQIERKRTTGDSSSEHVTREGTVKLERDASADRLRLIFPGKPSPETRGLLKKHGFRWAPTEGAWQRHLNSNGEYAASFVLKTIAA